jgi:endonuclease/exonuclease/phosphatase family metal-dependent hydrolase
VIALQEVRSSADGRCLVRELAEQLGAQPLRGATLLRRDSEYGNAVLSRYPVVALRRIDLSVPPHEPRGALDVVIAVSGRPLRLLATHLGLRPYERRTQIRLLLAALERDRDVPTVLTGDLNEWFLWGRPLRWLHQRFRPTPAPPTFPARRPLFALDRLWADPPAMLERLAVHSSALARVASDHLPLVATLDV